jgi:uncharacterized membrane protein
MVLPAGTEVPPPLYGAAVLVGVALVAWGLRRARPPVRPRTVVALSPWMVTGAALYVIEQLGLLPRELAPLAASPTVYLTAFALAGAVWLLALRAGLPVPAALAATGALALVAPVGLAVTDALAADTLRVVPSLVAVLIAGALAATVWAVLRRVSPGVAGTVGGAGALAVFAHALDGVSTAVGYDWLGFGERTPLSAALLEVGGALPTAQYVGAGWLFVAVKVALATALVVWLADYVRERPREGTLLLGAVAAFGLGPGAHNLLLFAVAGPT